MVTPGAQVEAYYYGTTSYGGNAAGEDLTVIAATTTTSVVAASPTATAGVPEEFTATVEAPDSTLTPTGWILGER